MQSNEYFAHQYAIAELAQGFLQLSMKLYHYLLVVLFLSIGIGCSTTKPPYHVITVTPFYENIPKAQTRHISDSSTEQDIVKAFFEFDEVALRHIAKSNTTADYVLRIYKALVSNDQKGAFELFLLEEERNTLPQEIRSIFVSELLLKDRLEVFYQKFHIQKTQDTTKVALQDLPNSVDTLCHPVIEVEIGGKQYLFLVDTGSTFSLIGDSVAKKISPHIVHTFDPDTITFTDANGIKKTEEKLTIVIDTFSIGTMHFVNMPLTIENTYLNVAGTIGQDLLQKLVLTVDCINKELLLSVAASDTAAESNVLYMTMAPYIEAVSTSGERLVGYFDTGANTSKVYNATVRQLYGEDVLERWYFDKATYTSTAQYSQKKGTDIVLTNPFEFYIDRHLVSIQYPKIRERNVSDFKRDFTIGMDMLQNMRFTLNGATRRFTIDSVLTTSTTLLPIGEQEKP